MARLNQTRHSLTADPRLEELDGEVRQFIEDVTEENTPEIPVERLNEILRGVLSDETPETAGIRDVLRGCLLNAKNSRIEWEKLQRVAKENEDEAIEAKEFAVKTQEKLQSQQTEIEELQTEIQTLERENTQLRQTRGQSTVSTSNTESILKPKEFKGTKFDGKPENLERFLNKLTMDFRLYESQFPTDRYKVAYAISGFDERPDRWAQQFHRYDPDKAIRQHFEDPDLMANRRAALLALKQKPTDDLIDHITEFEILCSQVSWPDETKASLFLETLSLGLKSSIRRSDVDLESYEKVKQKAQRLEREFQNTKKQRATQKTGQNEVRTVSNPDFKTNLLTSDKTIKLPNENLAFNRTMGAFVTLSLIIFSTAYVAYMYGSYNNTHHMSHGANTHGTEGEVMLKRAGTG
ncbi:hypothetical protein V1504DRAFT_472306 [Lipomyces starkeyi]